MSVIFTCSLLGKDLVLACGTPSDVAEHLEFAVPDTSGLLGPHTHNLVGNGKLQSNHPTQLGYSVIMYDIVSLSLHVLRKSGMLKITWILG